MRGKKEARLGFHHWCPFSKNQGPSTMPLAEGDAQGPLKILEIKICGHDSTFPMTECQLSPSWCCSDHCQGIDPHLSGSLPYDVSASMSLHADVSASGRWCLFWWAQAASSCAMPRYNSAPLLMGREKSYVYCKLIETSPPTFWAK